MGTDIHFAFEKRRDAGSPWEAFTPEMPADEIDTIGPYYEGRNYALFAILGNVRQPDPAFHHMSCSRGMPPGASFEVRRHHKDAGDRYLGDHNHTWLSLEECLAFDWGQTNTESGIITAGEFLSWDGTMPTCYCGGVSGRGVKVVEYPGKAPTTGTKARAWLEANGDPTDVRVSWEVKYCEVASAFIPLLAVLKTHGSPENVRMIIGFDS